MNDKEKDAVDDKRERETKQSEEIGLEELIGPKRSNKWQCHISHPP